MPVDCRGRLSRDSAQPQRAPEAPVHGVEGELLPEPRGELLQNLLGAGPADAELGLLLTVAPRLYVGLRMQKEKA